MGQRLMHDAWCVTPDTQIVYGKASHGRGTEAWPTPQADGLEPQNLDLVLWVINQKVCRQALAGRWQLHPGRCPERHLRLLIDRLPLG